MSEDRIHALVDAMSTQEKITLIAGRDSWTTAPIERLGIPSIKVTDGPNGARGGGAFVGGVTAAAFPVAISLSSSWNVELVGEIGEALAEEAKSKGARVLLAPTVNMHRSTLNGRNFECYSEDPRLTSEIAVAYIEGVQSRGVGGRLLDAALGYSHGATQRMIESSPDPRAMRRYHLAGLAMHPTAEFGGQPDRSAIPTSLPGREGDANDLDSIRQFSVCYLRREQDIDLQAFGVKFDHYFLETSLYTDGKVNAAVEALQHSGKTYEQDGALWLRTTDYGDDKDRVMKKSDGTYTYFVPDVAYHITKWQRGFKQAVNIQGSDHHGTVARVRAGLQAVGMNVPKGYPDYILHKMVTVMKDGAEVKLSKRAGSYVTLRDLIEWSGNGDIDAGRDAVRFFLISRKADTEFVFDVDVALARSDENPVYYVQYAHARICSVLEKVGADLVTDVLNQKSTIDLSPLTAVRDASLLAKLAEYPESLERALDELGPHQVAFYLRELAGEMHSYYNAERVLVEDEGLKKARVALLLATKQVLQNGLGLIGVTAPAKM